MGLRDMFKSKTTQEVAQETGASFPTQVAPTAAPAPAPASQGISLAKGSVSLAKGSSITLEKTAKITASVSWKSGTDYDVYALVLMRDGSVQTASYFGTNSNPKFTPSVANGAVKHLGDIGRDAGKSAAGALEQIEISLTPDILAVVPVAYSAQSNGTGSFRRYKVSLAVDNGKGDTVTVDAKNAENHDRIYTCVPAIIWNREHGADIQAVELYSKPGSENRPSIDRNGKITMDAGPRNAYK